jgi:hypothetical protein
VSKLGALVAIPLGLFAIKQLQKQFPDEKDSKPVVQEGFTLGPAGTDMDIAPLFPEGLQLTTRETTGLTATGPTVPLGMGTDVVPLFPDTAAGAAEEFAAKKPFEFKPELFPKIGDISSLDFETGLFDPEFQKGLRK